MKHITLRLTLIIFFCNSFAYFIDARKRRIEPKQTLFEKHSPRLLVMFATLTCFCGYKFFLQLKKTNIQKPCESAQPKEKETIPSSINTNEVTINNSLITLGIVQQTGISTEIINNAYKTRVRALGNISTSGLDHATYNQRYQQLNIARDTCLEILNHRRNIVPLVEP